MVETLVRAYIKQHLVRMEREKKRVIHAIESNRNRPEQKTNNPE